MSHILLQAFFFHCRWTAPSPPTQPTPTFPHSTPEPLLLSAALFLWQFPHFFALSWVHRRDYARGGFRMVPCADPTGMRTADLILR